MPNFDFISRQYKEICDFYKTDYRLKDLNIISAIFFGNPFEMPIYYHHNGKFDFIQYFFDDVIDVTVLKETILKCAMRCYDE